MSTITRRHSPTRALILISAFLAALCSAPASVAQSSCTDDVEAFAEQLVADSAAVNFVDIISGGTALKVFVERFADGGNFTRPGAVFEGPYVVPQDFEVGPYDPENPNPLSVFEDGGAGLQLFQPIANQAAELKRVFEVSSTEGDTIVIETETVVNLLGPEAGFGPSAPVTIYEVSIIVLNEMCKITDWKSYAPAVRLLEQLSVALDRPITLPRGEPFNSEDPLDADVRVGLVVGPGVDCNERGALPNGRLDKEDRKNQPNNNSDGRGNSSAM